MEVVSNKTKPHLYINIYVVYEVIVWPFTNNPDCGKYKYYNSIIKLLYFLKIF